MSMLNTYLQTEQQMKQLQEKLKKLENDDRFKAEVGFKNKLEGLMKEYDKSAADVMELLNPTEKAKPTGASRPQRTRKLKIYKNPNTGEVVETRGGNQKTLKAWKDEFGVDTVESWLVRVED